MKISTQAIKYINEHYHSAGDPAQNGVDELVQKIGAQLGAVEEVIAFGKRFEDVVIVKVVSCEDHPNADRLHVCKVDDGGVVKDIDRDENGHVQVVCGAPNVRAGMLAAWLPPGATVPSTLGEEDPFVLGSRELRGVVSNGMMASPRELTLGDSHEGILEIDEELGPITPGTMFVDAFHLKDDMVIDMENKMFTHRPDCFGWLGIARELEGINNRQYTSPEWYVPKPEFPAQAGTALPLEVRNELPELVPRFTAITLSNVTVKQSPVWLQVDLARAGLRPINNIVDYTNFYMLLTGQPLHAYDYDQVKALSDNDAAVLVVRRPQEGERITLLNGKEVAPRPEAIMIATPKRLVGIGGIMGGADTEVRAETKNIIIECASFDMYSIRRTSMTHGLFTDAVTRFNKGQSPLQNLAVLAKITDQIVRHAGAQVASAVVDDVHAPAEVLDRASVHAPVTVSTDFINARLGWQLAADEMVQLLTNVEFAVEQSGNDLTVTAPFWRTDIEIPEDVIEEVGRLYGYDHLPLQLPVRDLTPAAKNAGFSQKTWARDRLSAAGANEVLTYTFVHGDMLKKVGQDPDQAFQLSNALSPELQYFRLSLTPSLLEKIHPNIRAGHEQFALYEINKVHTTTEMDEDGLPREFTRLALVFAADEKTAAAQFAGAPYYQARKYLIDLLEADNALLDISFIPLTQADPAGHKLTEQLLKPFEPGRAAAIVYKDHIAGVVGEYRAAVAKAMKLPAFTAGFEISTSFLGQGSGVPYVQLPRFPKVTQDICFKVPTTMLYAQLSQFVWEHLAQHRPDATFHTLSPIDIYQREDDAEHKQITLRITLASYERTLTDAEVAQVLDGVAGAARDALGAERI